MPLTTLQILGLGLVSMTLVLSGCGGGAPTPTPAPPPGSSRNVPMIHLETDRLGVFVDLKVGSPPQVVSVLFDSGSGTLGISSKTVSTTPLCVGDVAAMENGSCVVGQYNPVDSKSASNYSADQPYCNTTVKMDDGSELCTFAVSYGDHSGMSGSIAWDMVQVGGLSANVSFGVVTHLQDTNDSQMQEPPANGIMGVSAAPNVNCNRGVDQSSDLETCRPDAFNAIMEKHGLDNKFGVCMGTPNLGQAPIPGVMTLGGSDSTLYSGDMIYSPLVNELNTNPSTGDLVETDSIYYDIEVLGWGVNGKTQVVKPEEEKPGSSYKKYYGTVDTGTALTYLPIAIAKKLTFPKCKSDNDCLLTLEVTGACLSLFGAVVCNTASGDCEAKTITTQAGATESSTMIGYSSLMNMYIEFDRQGRQVGFANRSSTPCKNDCSSYIAEESCKIGGCQWNGDAASCSGEGIGNPSGGSIVVPGRCPTASATNGMGPQNAVVV